MKRPSEVLSKSFRRSTDKSQEKKEPEQLVYKTTATRKTPTFAHARYFTRLLKGQERIVFLIAAVIILVGLPIVGLRWYYRATEVVPDYGGSYTEGIVGAPQYINPILSPLSDVDSDLTEFIFSGLFRYTDQQELVSDLTTNYVISDDKLTYTFFLRSDVKWHDGEDLTADDVLFTINAIQDPLYQSPLYASLAGAQTEKLDDYSFSITLPEPYAPFLSTMTFGIVPEHLWFDVPAQNVALTELNIRPVGTGPYKFESLTKERTGTMKSFYMVRNEEYYGNNAYLKDITFIFYPEITSAVDALKSKKIEGLSFFPIVEREDIQKKNSNIAFTSLRIPQYTAVFFNQKKSDVLKQDTVRRALAHSVNRDEIVDQVFYGGAEAIYTPILPGYVGHNPEVKKFEFDLEEAARLLESEGWVFPEVAEEEPAEDEAEVTEEATEEGADENSDEEPAEDTESTDDTVSEANSEVADYIPREKDGTKLEFTIATVDNEEYRSVLMLMQKNWKEIGIKVNVDFYSPEDIQQEVIKPREYEALLFGEIVGTDPDPYPFWHSSQQEHPGLALAIFRDQEVNQLLEEARQTSDEEERRLKYLHFQNNIAEEGPAIFLYNPLYTYGVHEKIQGINSMQYITVPSDRFSNITNWYIETKREW